jgi:hypothetical protein
MCLQEVWQSFAARCVLLLERRGPGCRPLCCLPMPAPWLSSALNYRNCEALRDFTGERGGASALDYGCGTGGTSFELATIFRQARPTVSSWVLLLPSHV